MESMVRYYVALVVTKRETMIGVVGYGIDRYTELAGFSPSHVYCNAADVDAVQAMETGLKVIGIRIPIKNFHIGMERK